MKVKKPRYVVCPSGQRILFYRTKKEITKEYGFTYEQINHSLLGYPLRKGERVYWIYYYTCKFCEDYMIESKRCHNCEKMQGD